MSQPTLHELPHANTVDLLGPQQFGMLESIATYDPNQPSDDARTTVAAHYVLEQQTLLQQDLFTTAASEQAFQQAWREQSREGRLELLLQKRIQQRGVPTPDSNDFNALMASYAAAGAEQWLRQGHQETLDRQMFSAVGKVSLSLSESQVDWEVSHGTVDKIAREDFFFLDGRYPNFVDAGIRAVRRTFSKNNMQSMSPAELAEAIRYPIEGAGIMISELVASGILVRNIDQNTITLDPKFKPIGLRGLLRRFLNLNLGV